MQSHFLPSDYNASIVGFMSEWRDNLCRELLKLRREWEQLERIGSSRSWKRRLRPSKLSFTASVSCWPCSELSTVNDTVHSTLESQELARVGMDINMSFQMLCGIVFPACLCLVSLASGRGKGCSNPSPRWPALVWGMARSVGSISGNWQGGPLALHLPGQRRGSPWPDQANFTQGPNPGPPPSDVNHLSSIYRPFHVV